MCNLLKTICYFIGMIAFCASAPAQPSAVVQPRIVNGNPSAPGQFPYIALLQITRSTTTTICGGSLLNRDWILTAGHCASNARHISIHLGAHRIENDTTNEPNRVVVTANLQSSVIHSGYNQLLALNDIALLRLQSTIQFSAFIQPVRLPAANSGLFVGRTVLASGWGRKYTQAGIHAEELQWARLVVITNDECRRSLSSIAVRDTTMCAIGPMAESVCNGDSGGPLVLDGYLTRTLIGVVSFGHRNGCDLGHPQGFTRVTEYLSWITRHTGIQTM